MAQVTNGFRAVLSYPSIYDTLQNIMGAQQIRRDLIKNFIRPTSHSRILDIGCGTAEILRSLDESIEYWGYDISQDYIEAAKTRFGTRGKFQCAHLDRAELVKLPKFDIVLAVGVLHHLDNDVAENLFALARDALNEGGRMITIDPCLSSGQNAIARYLILQDRGQNVRDSEGYRALAMKSFPRVEGTLRQRTWIPYTHWIMECSR